MNNCEECGDLMKVNKFAAEHYNWGEQCDGWLLEQSPERTIIHERMPAGTKEIRHVHRIAKQFFFQLSGVGTMEMEEEVVTLNPHEGITVLPGAWHQMRNDSEEDIEFIVISTPSTKGDRFEG
jgi:mannose-6-phosphate isomerase-like protein (cupin superfamily)